MRICVIKRSACGRGATSVDRLTPWRMRCTQGGLEVPNLGQEMVGMQRRESSTYTRGGRTTRRSPART